MRQLLVSILLGLSFVGCTTMDVIKLREGDSEKRTPTTSVDIYTSKAEIKRPHQEFAVIVVGDPEDMVSESTMVNKAREKAKQLGADAIYFGTSSRTSGGVVIGNMYLNESSQTVRAVAVEYTDKSSRDTASK